MVNLLLESLELLKLVQILSTGYLLRILSLITHPVSTFATFLGLDEWLSALSLGIVSWNRAVALRIQSIVTYWRPGVTIGLN